MDAGAQARPCGPVGATSFWNLRCSCKKFLIRISDSSLLASSHHVPQPARILPLAGRDSHCLLRSESSSPWGTWDLSQSWEVCAKAPPSGLFKEARPSRWRNLGAPGGAWWAAVHGIAKSRTRLSDFTFTFSLSCIGEGNGNPLQCSCLENPRDVGAWWAAVYGVTQSWTRLKRLSSSSSSSRWSLQGAACGFKGVRGVCSGPEGGAGKGWIRMC